MSLTDEQAMALYRSRYGKIDIAVDAGRLLTAHQQYERLVEAGWTIKPPKPRFVVNEFSDQEVFVMDRHDGLNTRKFWAIPDVESYDDTVAAAQAEADRLNRGDA